MREILLSSHNWEYDDFEWTYTSPEFPVAQVSCIVLTWFAYLLFSEKGGGEGFNGIFFWFT
jgi:hypothetical protein